MKIQLDQDQNVQLDKPKLTKAHPSNVKQVSWCCCCYKERVGGSMQAVSQTVCWQSSLSLWNKNNCVLLLWFFLSVDIKGWKRERRHLILHLWLLFFCSRVWHLNDIKANTWLRLNSWWQQSCWATSDNKSGNTVFLHQNKLGRSSKQWTTKSFAFALDGRLRWWTGWELANSVYLGPSLAAKHRFRSPAAGWSKFLPDWFPREIPHHAESRPGIWRSAPASSNRVAGSSAGHFPELGAQIPTPEKNWRRQDFWPSKIFLLLLRLSWRWASSCWAAPAASSRPVAAKRWRTSARSVRPDQDRADAIVPSSTLLIKTRFCD